MIKQSGQRNPEPPVAALAERVHAYWFWPTLGCGACPWRVA